MNYNLRSLSLYPLCLWISCLWCNLSPMLLSAAECTVYTCKHRYGEWVLISMVQLQMISSLDFCENSLYFWQLWHLSLSSSSPRLNHFFQPFCLSKTLVAFLWQLGAFVSGLNAVYGCLRMKKLCLAWLRFQNQMVHLFAAPFWQVLTELVHCLLQCKTNKLHRHTNKIVFSPSQSRKLKNIWNIKLSKWKKSSTIYHNSLLLTSWNVPSLSLPFFPPQGKLNLLKKFYFYTFPFYKKMLLQISM